MAEPSILAQSLCRLLEAMGWTAHADRSTVEATEPAFEPVTRKWMAGRASSITPEEVEATAPSRIIVEDMATPAQIERLRDLLPDVDGQPTRVWTYTAFIDELWGASAAVARAIADAEADDPDALFGEERGFNDRHITQTVKFSTHSTTDHRALEYGLPADGTWLAILADAGLGKSEFLRLHEWRYAQMYESSRRTSPHIKLPPIALRVSLRDFRSLSLDYIAHAISQPIQRGSRMSLPRISSGALLRELLIQGRLILLLDGLDEVIAESSAIDSGLTEWHRAVSAGGRMVLASRPGHASADGAIARRFREDQTARLQHLDRAEALQLLEKRGATTDEASAIMVALKGPSAEIPLYLVLANHVRLDGELPDAVRTSKTLVLQTLVEHFCEREVPRLGVDSAQQMEILDQIAEWLTMRSGYSPADLLDELGIDSEDAIARVVLNPHALLLLNRDGHIEFKFTEFEKLFAARSLATAWKEIGIKSVMTVLRTKQLDSLVIEYLARLIHTAVISGAWIESGSDPEHSRLLRRNLLGIALAKVQDNAVGAPANIRAASLASILGNRALTNLSLSGLTLERFDLGGWELKGLRGRDGALAYCENLSKADFDDTVHDLTLEGCSFEDSAAAEVDLEEAISRLGKLVRPLRRKTGGTLVTMMSVEEARDPLIWTSLQKAGLAERTGKAKASKWELTSDGTRILTAFNAAHVRGDEVLLDLVSNDAELRSLLKQIAAVR